MFVATPNHHHCLPLLMAIRRGIHVYAEKPLAKVLMLGNATARVGKGTYAWDGTKFTQGTAANQYW